MGKRYKSCTLNAIKGDKYCPSSSSIITIHSHKCFIKLAFSWQFQLGSGAVVPTIDFELMQKTTLCFSWTFLVSSSQCLYKSLSSFSSLCVWEISLISYHKTGKQLHLAKTKLSGLGERLKYICMYRWFPNWENTLSAVMWWYSLEFLVLCWYIALLIVFNGMEITMHKFKLPLSELRLRVLPSMK